MLRRLRSFKRGAVGLCRSIGIKVASCQSWRFEKNSATRPISNHTSSYTIGSSSNFDSLQLCSQLTYRDPQHLFGKISTSLTNSISIKRTKRIFNTSYGQSNKPHLHRAYVIGGGIFFWLAVKSPFPTTVVSWMCFHFLWMKRLSICCKAYIHYYLLRTLLSLFPERS